MSRLKCIINPVAASGRARAIWPAYLDALQGAGIAFEAVQTTHSGHATELARHALHDGWPWIVAVGGDGTVNEVVNGFFEQERPINPEAVLAVVPQGTGTDFARTAPLPRSPETFLRSVQQKCIRRIDVGCLRCTGPDGAAVQRYFVNIADFGFGGTVAAKVNGYTKILGSFLAYISGLLYVLVAFKNPKVSLRLDDSAPRQGRFFAVIAANGQYFGGGMWIAPQAVLDDGAFEFALIEDVSKLEVVRNLRRLYRGTLHEHPKAVYLRGCKLEAWSDETVLIDMDGEMPGRLPATFELLPASLQLAIAEPHPGAENRHAGARQATG